VRPGSLDFSGGSEVTRQRTPSSDIKQFTVTYLCVSRVRGGTHAVSSEWARNAKKVGDTDRHVDSEPYEIHDSYASCTTIRRCERPRVLGFDSVVELIEGMKGVGGMKLADCPWGCQ
jgi:hypothetical protein